jgi:hypothetical protein
LTVYNWLWEKIRIYDDFSEIWDMQHNIQIGIEERFHKNILMLAAGSFGVSFAFINQVIPLKEALQANVLFFSWFFTYRCYT